MRPASRPDFESSADAYPVKLDQFEGPLDLLLHLIKKNEVNIHDIPIALITQQYLETIQLMQELNLDVAGEFLVMAATLIHIKSKMLLPRPEPAAARTDEEDPRDALVRRLLEHQKFKAAAELLHEREQLRARSGSGPTSAWPRSPATSTSRSSRSISSACMAAFQAVVERAKQRPKVCCRPSRFRSKCASSSCWRGCRRPRPAASRSCLPTSTIAAG